MWIYGKNTQDDHLQIMWGPVINLKSGKSLRGFLLMSKICLVYLRLGLKAMMGNERLNETLSMFSVVAKAHLRLN